MTEWGNVQDTSTIYFSIKVIKQIINDNLSKRPCY